MKFRFTKMYCSGNDFVVMDAVTQRLFLSPQMISRLADRTRGIGFSRIAVIEPPYDPDLDFFVQVYDPDGQDVKACIDALACCTYFVTQKNLTVTRKPVELSSLSGAVSGKCDMSGAVTLSLQTPVFVPASIPFRAQNQEKTYILQVSGRNIFCSALSVGTPCCVVQQPSVDADEAVKISQALSSHERFPSGCSVCFYETVSRSALRVSLPCGGDAVAGGTAAAVIGVSHGFLEPAVTVSVADSQLKIRWPGDSSRVSCTVTPSFVYDGEIDF
jgi:diaminopimelate epimerase